MTCSILIALLHRPFESNQQLRDSSGDARYCATCPLQTRLQVNRFATDHKLEAACGAQLVQGLKITPLAAGILDACEASAHKQPASQTYRKRGGEERNVVEIDRRAAIGIAGDIVRKPKIELFQ